MILTFRSFFVALCVTGIAVMVMVIAAYKTIDQPPPPTSQAQTPQIAQTSDTAQAIIRCDVDGQLMPLKGSVVMRDGHIICDLHILFNKQGQVVCPLDGSIGRGR